MIAAKSPGDCFDTAIEAAQIAMRFMTPVILLSDGYLANGSEPWKIPIFENLPKIPVLHPTNENRDDGFQPYRRNEELARPWALPGTPGLEHRLGGLEKEDVTGNVCYDPANHQRMTNLRAQKVANVSHLIPPTQFRGAESGDLLVIGWGGTFGSISTAIDRCRRDGLSVSSIHLRYLNPLPPDLGDILHRFDRILIPELNSGQLRAYLNATYLCATEGLNKVQGKPFLVSEICAKIREMIGEKVPV